MKPFHMIQPIWEKIHTSNGPATRSIRGGDAPRFHLPVNTAMQAHGRGGWDTIFGDQTHRGDSSAMTIGGLL